MVPLCGTTQSRAESLSGYWVMRLLGYEVMGLCGYWVMRLWGYVVIGL